MTGEVVEFSPDTRRTQRQALIPAIYKTQYERLAVELALGFDTPEAIFESYRMTPEQAFELLEQAAFQALLERVSKEVREAGVSFRMKARTIAEALLPEAFEMATDPLCSSAVRADLIKWAAKVAALEPREGKDEAKQGGGLTLNITFAGEATKQIIHGREPITIEA